jgi:hypothetical protein
MSTLERTLVLCGLLMAVTVPVHAQRITQDEALSLAFPDADVRRETAFLSEAELERARAAAGDDVDVEVGLVTYYVAYGDDGPVGVAYFDAHRVRTLDEVLMIVVNPSGGVLRIETVSFREPPEYEAPEGWLALYAGSTAEEDLSLKGEIPTIIGATLTSLAVSDAVRRTLALHGVVEPFAGGTLP